MSTAIVTTLLVVLHAGVLAVPQSVFARMYPICSYALVSDDATLPHQKSRQPRQSQLNRATQSGLRQETGGRVGGGRCRPKEPLPVHTPPKEPYMIVSHHTAQASQSPLAEAGNVRSSYCLRDSSLKTVHGPDGP